ncbi:LmeA family phospholipid-binding protein [Streptomyces sporangiiformans]|uniref:DUF2993 domain-containing protein n=1 Tax=Streptomyces sporangiiformans TaxID=2315329 RepID=A0A505D2B2_9ACTN|nr:DUF2993 domain-containing protein [Streptomyces sporangiiformans]TPQ16342.1 DUF2993 domain-containing protein [Streptomyces sporangiiformans]
MRTPHRIATHPTKKPLYTDPYEELGTLDDGPLEEFLHEDVDDSEHADDRENRGEGEDLDGPASAAEDWAPPNHRRRGARRRRNRFAGLPLALKAVIGLLVLAAFLTLGDRWAVLYAEHAAADKLKDQLDLSAAPEVEINGFPFLTQLADSRVDNVKVTVPDVAAARVSLAKVEATASGIEILGGPTSIRGARIPRLQGEVLLSFEDLNRELGASQVTFSGHGRDQVRARGMLAVAGHDLRLRADARIQRDGERGIATEIGGMRLDIGDLATYRPGSRPSEGLHLTPKSAQSLAKQTEKAKALLSVPAIVQRLGIPDAAVQDALRDDTKLAELTGSSDFARKALKLNLIDAAVDNPEVLKLLGFDPALLDGLTQLTRPVLVDRLSLGFRLPKPADGDVRLQDVRVQKDGIRVRVTGEGLSIGG